jgi:hypothetical protein|tara:strand:- start:161 stop:484 length:324 start_codon:yes stop_codon:yes gene_type:complete
MTTKTITSIGLTETKIYQCPTDKTAIVSRVSVSNISDSLSTFHIAYYNSTDNNTVYFIKNGVLDTGQNHTAINSSGTLSMSADDYITVLSNTDSSIDAIVTYEESDV